MLPHLTRLGDDGSGLLTSRAAALAERGEGAIPTLALLGISAASAGRSQPHPCWRHQRPSHCCHQGTESKGASQNPIVTVLTQPHPTPGAQRHLSVSRIHSEEKPEEPESFLENPDEKIPSCLTSPPLDIKNGHSAAVGRLCVLHSWGFFAVLLFFPSQEEQDNHKK